MLAVLALEVNRLVPVTRLVDLVWIDSPPASARRMIHTHISGLRAILKRHEADRHGVTLHGESGGYLLRCDPTQIDVHRFQNLVADARSCGDDQRRAVLLEEALGLWHGPALAGVCDEDTRVRLSHHLDEGRLAAAEDRGDALLRLGRNDTLISEHTALAEHHSHRQRLASQLMLALYRTGRTPKRWRCSTAPAVP